MSDTVHHRFLPFLILCLIVLVGWGAVRGVQAAPAAAYTVINTADSGAGSLRDAVASANSSPGADVITFDAGLAGQTITLTGGEIVISESVSIDASSLSTPVTISGNNSSRVFQVDVSNTETMSFTGLRIVDGLADEENGGALLVANSRGLGDVDITVTDTVFENNTATYEGGAIRLNNSGTLRVDNSTFLNNTAGTYGGGIQNSNGTVRVTNSTFSGNKASAGGALHNAGSMTLHVTNSTFLRNGTSSAGSSVYNNIGGVMHLANNIMYGTLASPFDAPICNNLGTLSTNSQNWIDYDDNCGPAYTGNPYLSPPDDNGGATPTAALAPFSGAAGAGDSAYCPAADQRGVSRAANCDLGAFEVQASDYQSICRSGLAQGETYIFSSTGISTTIDTLGSLSQLCVTLHQSNHPNATAGLQTGLYWDVSATAGSNDWSLTMSAPTTFTLDGSDRLCRYTGTGTTWDCGASGNNSVSGDRVTRSGITQLSDWAVGDNVGPTSVTLAGVRAASSGSPWAGIDIAALAGLLCVVLGLVTVFVERRWR